MKKRRKDGSNKEIDNVEVECQLIYVKCWSYLLGQKFSACFALKFMFQRAELVKKEGMQISKQSTQSL